MSTTPDDLEAVKTIVKSLEPFPDPDRERIIRWVREKLGLVTIPLQPTAQSTHGAAATASTFPGGTKDIKSFIAEKNPMTDKQFAAAVAYYFRFEAPATERKESISSDDLQDACRKAGRDRLKKPAQTLINAHHTGLLDKAAGTGLYSINSVGENLVAMTLPNSPGRSRPTKPSRSPRKNRTSQKGKK